MELNETLCMELYETLFITYLTINSNKFMLNKIEYRFSNASQKWCAKYGVSSSGRANTAVAHNRIHAPMLDRL